MGINLTILSPEAQQARDLELQTGRLKLQQAQQEMAMGTLETMRRVYPEQELVDQVRQGTPLGQKVVELGKLAYFGNADAPLPTRQRQASLELPTGQFKAGTRYGEEPLIAPTEQVQYSQTVPVLPVSPAEAYYRRTEGVTDPRIMFREAAGAGAFGSKLPTPPVGYGTIESENLKNTWQGYKAMKEAPYAGMPTSLKEYNAAQGNKGFADFLASQKPAMEVMVGPDGQVTFRQGPGVGKGGNVLTPAMGTDVQKKVEQATETLRQLEGMAQNYDPKFLQIPARLGMEWAALKDKAGVDLDPAAKQDLESYATWRRRAFGMMNQTLNQLSGAAVSEHEMRRLTKQLPNPGTNAFNGDSPQEYLAKLKDSLQNQRRVVARYNYIRKQGFKDIREFSRGGRVLDLGSVDHLIDSEGQRIEREIKAANPSLGKAQVDEQVARQLETIFGLRF